MCGETSPSHCSSARRGLFSHHPFSMPWIRCQICQAKEAIDPGHQAVFPHSWGMGTPGHVDGVLEERHVGYNCCNWVIYKYRYLVGFCWNGNEGCYTDLDVEYTNHSHRHSRRLISSLWVCLRMVRMPSAAFIC